MSSSKQSRESATGYASSTNGRVPETPETADLVEGDASGEALSVSPWRRINRLAIKVAGVSLVVAVAGVGVGALVSDLWSTAFMVSVPLLVFVGTYVACVLVLAGRLELARTLLRQIRKHQFENLEAAHLPIGDELNDLVWQVYRTGQVLEREMSELRRMENYRREFIGNVSHELKTPIFAIRGYAETLENGALDDTRVNRSFVKKIVRNADRLDNLARDLSEIARIEQGELTMELEPFDFRALAAETADSLEPRASSRDVRIRLSIPQGLPPVVGDVNHLRQVLANLIENAIKYNDAGGSVEVVARRIPNGDVKISVVDNGIGIPEDLLPRITERFYRVDKSRSRSQGGTGLGLAIVKHILAAHDRTLNVESKVGAGSTFGFSLPVFEETLDIAE